MMSGDASLFSIAQKIPVDNGQYRCVNRVFALVSALGCGNEIRISC